MHHSLLGFCEKNSSAQAAWPRLRVQLGEPGVRPKQLPLNTAEGSDCTLAWMVLQGFDDKWPLRVITMKIQGEMGTGACSVSREFTQAFKQLSPYSRRKRNQQSPQFMSSCC
jgi:hypothetical protein